MRDYTEPMSMGDVEPLSDDTDESSATFSSVLKVHPGGVSMAPVYPGLDPYGNEAGTSTVTRNHKAGRLFKAGRP